VTNDQLIQACKNRDRKGQKAFVDEYSSYLYGICLRYVKYQQEAEDCLQESLVRILTKIDKYDGEGSFKSWISKVTANQCLQHLRRNKKHLYMNIEEGSTQVHPTDINAKLELKEVLRFIDQLPDNYRIAINMYTVEGFSHKEIAKELGIAESSSRSLVTRGRQMINEFFEEIETGKIQNLNGHSTPFNILKSNKL